MLSDPNMDPDYLGMLVMVGVNKKKFKPSVTAMKERYHYPLLLPNVPRQGRRAVRS